MPSRPGSDILVIGYGNELRGDDGSGPAVARAIEALRLPCVRTQALHQLTPELAEDIAAARAVILVDAHQASEGSSPKVLPLAPCEERDLRAHTSDPGALLALAKALYGRCPPAWLVAVPAARFNFGAALSPMAEAGVAAAVEKVRALCAQAASA
jgi:hydrogenase maturation protease